MPHLAYKKQPCVNENPMICYKIEKIDQLGKANLEDLCHQRKIIIFWIGVR